MYRFDGLIVAVGSLVSLVFFAILGVLFYSGANQIWEAGQELARKPITISVVHIPGEFPELDIKKN